MSKGVRLRPGDRAVVVDAGRHHITSFSSLYHPAGTRRPRPGRGVTIRLAEGDEAVVPRKHLELVAPDHPLAPEPDGFTIPAAQDAGYSSSQGKLDTFTAEALVDVLAGATTTPDDVFIAVWEGFGDVPAHRFPGAAHLDTQARGHFLLRGPLTGALSSVAVSNIDRPAAGLWWPADRAWLVATEIAVEWTFVAGDPTHIESLRAEERLEVALTTFDAAANRAAEPT